MTEDPRPPGRLHRLIAKAEWWHLLVLLPVLVNMWFLRHMLLTVSWPNDVPFHVSMSQWAADRISAGHLPLDGWYSRLSGGYPQFHMYQSLPHQITGFVGQFSGVDEAVNAATYLLWCTWPISVFIAARAFGLDRVAALTAAFASPFLASAASYGYELSSYTWVGYGLWSQLWGMWVFPLALAWSARAVADGKRMVRAVVAMTLLVAFHLPTAWFALLAVGLWFFVRPSEWRYRLPRVTVIGLGSVIMASWVVVPLIVDQWAAMATTFEDPTDPKNFFANSFGWRKAGRWLIEGDLLDFAGDTKGLGQWPLLTVAAAVGLAVALRRWNRRPIRWARELPFLLVAGIVLFFGRNPFGWLINWLPGSDLVFLHRYHIVTQLVGLLLAGVAVSVIGTDVLRLVRRVGAWTRETGAVDGGEPDGVRANAAEHASEGPGPAWYVPNASAESIAQFAAIPQSVAIAGAGSGVENRRGRRWELAVSAAAALVILIPAFARYHHSVSYDRDRVLQQQKADLGPGRDAAKLIALAHERGGGRIYGGRINNWGDTFYVGSSPMPILLGHYPIDQIGYNLRVSGLSADLETFLNDTEAAQLRLLGIKFFIAPRAQPVAKGLTLLAASGPYYLWEVPDSRWMEAVNVVGPKWTVQRDALGNQVLNALGSVDLQGFDRQLMSLDGKSGGEITADSRGLGSPGRIIESDVDTAAGRFDAKVTMVREGAVIAKTNWHPRWTVTVDGKPASTFMVTPMQLAVAVPEGQHTVEFRYKSYPLYWLWFALGTLVLFGLCRWGRVEDRLAVWAPRNKAAVARKLAPLRAQVRSRWAAPKAPVSGGTGGEGPADAGEGPADAGEDPADAGEDPAELPGEVDGERNGAVEG